MWRNTRSFATDVARTAIFAMTLAVAGTGVCAEPPALPAAVTAVAPNLRVQGGGEMTFWGISVYDGWFWSSTAGWPRSGAYALDLTYHRGIEGTKIAQRSLEEIAQLGYGSSADRARWGEQMARIFPDVNKGDRLTGVTAGKGSVRYFHNGRMIGEIAEPDFVRAFFAIWLDPRSSAADFRKKLLGEQ